MDKFQKLYNAEIKIYSSGAMKTTDLERLYPKYKVEKPAPQSVLFKKKYSTEKLRKRLLTLR